MNRFIWFVCFLMISLSSNAAMYKCTDAKGNVSFTDQPCKEQKQEVLKDREQEKSTSKSSQTPSRKLQYEERDDDLFQDVKSCVAEARRILQLDETGFNYQVVEFPDGCDIKVFFRSNEERNKFVSARKELGLSLYQATTFPYKEGQTIRIKLSVKWR